MGDVVLHITLTTLTLTAAGGATLLQLLQLIAAIGSSRDGDWAGGGRRLSCGDLAEGRLLPFLDEMAGLRGSVIECLAVGRGFTGGMMGEGLDEEVGSCAVDGGLLLGREGRAGLEGEERDELYPAGIVEGEEPNGEVLVEANVKGVGLVVEGDGGDGEGDARGEELVPVTYEVRSQWDKGKGEGGKGKTDHR